jgi:hypothetical protein
MLVQIKTDDILNSRRRVFARFYGWIGDANQLEDYIFRLSKKIYSFTMLMDTN